MYGAEVGCVRHPDVGGDDHGYAKGGSDDLENIAESDDVSWPDAEPTAEPAENIEYAADLHDTGDTGDVADDAGDWDDDGWSHGEPYDDRGWLLDEMRAPHDSYTGSVACADLADVSDEAFGKWKM